MVSKSDGSDQITVADEIAACQSSRSRFRETSLPLEYDVMIVATKLK